MRKVVSAIDRKMWLLACVVVIVAFPSAVNPATKPRFTRTLEHYALPDVTLINQNGARVRLASILNSDRPVMVDFIYATCTTICPVLSANFTNLQDRLGAESRSVHLVSISIDPDHDTPPVMKEYLKRYGARPGWDFLTGSRADIDKVVKVFKASTSPNKMSHEPLILIKPPGAGSRWVRISGFVGTAELLAEYRQALGR